MLIKLKPAKAKLVTRVLKESSLGYLNAYIQQLSFITNVICIACILGSQMIILY